MKSRILFAVATVFLLAASTISYGQPEPPGPEGRNLKEPRREKEALQQVIAFNGQAGAWVNNDDYVYDGFYLQTGTEKFLVKFPPHMGAEIKAAVKNGSSITVKGVSQTSPEGDKEIRMVSITTSGKTINETPPAAPVTPLAEEFVTGSSKISNLQKNKLGDVSGLVLANKTILRVPPHVIKQLGLIATMGSNISYTGVKKTIKTGEATAADFTIVHCKTITINGTEYLTR